MSSRSVHPSIRKYSLMTMSSRAHRDEPTSSQSVARIIVISDSPLDPMQLVIISLFRCDFYYCCCVRHPSTKLHSIVIFISSIRPIDPHRHDDIA